MIYELYLHSTFFNDKIYLYKMLKVPELGLGDHLIPPAHFLKLEIKT